MSEEIDSMPTPATASPVSTPASDGTGTNPYRWFVRLWPLAVLFHLAGNDAHLLSLTRIGLVQIPFAIAAGAMLVRPSARRAFVLAALHLPVLYFKLPQVGNHEVLLFLVNLSVMLSVATRPKAWLERAVPAMRWVLLIGYSAIAFSKLNSGFIDHAVSCAVVFGDEFASWVNVSVSNSTPVATLVIAITLLAELAIPILLMIRKLRHFGVVLGLGFHTLLALEPAGHVFDFTSVLFVLFPLFLAPVASERVAQAIDRAHQARPARQITLAIVALAACNVLILKARQQGIALAWWLAEFPIFLAYAYFLLRTIIPQAIGTRSQAPKMVVRFAPVLVVVVLLTSLNAVSPYTELRTAGAFNMYSNLDTSAGETNHLLLPGTLPLRDEPRLYSFAGDPDADVESNALLAFYGDTDFVVPEANLAAWARNNPDDDTLVQLVGRGERLQTVPVSSLATEAGFGDSLLDRIFYIRAVDLDEPRDCARFWGPAH